MNFVGSVVLKIGLGECEVQARFWTPIHISVVADVQLWLDQYPKLRPGETFFIGMWPTKIMATDVGACLGEYDFSIGDYVPCLERCITLWIEQDQVCRSRDVTWHSVQPNSLLWLTPSVIHSVGEDLMEGLHNKREIAPGSLSSGWFIYTNEDRKRGDGWVPMRMIDALSRLDMQILRFLGVPEGWTFQITKDQQTYLWSNEEEEASQFQASQLL